MIRTVVCNKNGCNGNKFNIKSLDNKIQVICTECNEKYTFDNNYTDYSLLSSCSSCNNISFKVFKDMETEQVYAKCDECGSPPEKIYIDDMGIQISYEEKLLYDVKSLMERIDQKIMGLEYTIKDVERGQELLEQSIAYINKFMLENR